MKKYFTILLLTLTFCGASAVAQTYDTLKVMSYNLLNYPGSNSSSRNPEFRKTLLAVNPDVLIVQEMQSSSGTSEFLGQVLNFGQPGTYSNAPFLNGPDTDNAFFFKSSRVQYVSTTTLTTALRDINGYRFRPAGVNSDSLDIWIFSAHLKASQGFESDREAEATILRNHLNSLGPGHYIFGGDFNLYTSSEPAWTVLTGSQADNDGRLYDPINQPGSWNNSASFAAIHTQSTRLTDIGDGGSTGGLDDRFDFLLPTYLFQSLPSWQYVAGSYTSYGNDGNHFNQSINNGFNAAVPDSIADALHTCSDHLPVFMKIVRQVGAMPSITIVGPNGGESFGTGDTLIALWNTTAYSGAVTISLSRNGVGGPFETLASNTADDGVQSWIVSGAATGQARVRIEMNGAPYLSDLSDADFSIFTRNIAIYTPADMDTAFDGSSKSVEWTSVGVSGNVKVELRRDTSSGTWETLASSVTNSGSYSWAVTSPLAQAAQFRVSSVSAPTVGDSSGYFRILAPNDPPLISHNPVCDAVPGDVVFRAWVEDSGMHDDPKLYFSSDEFVTTDSLTLTPSSGGFAASRIFADGFYDYFIRVKDAGNLTASTDTFRLRVQSACGSALTYDDGEADSYQWSPETGFSWAVKFSPPGTPFVLCDAAYALSVRKPDSALGTVRIRVQAADGLGGIPGTLLRELTVGAAPNWLSGSAGVSPGWGRCVLRESGQAALTVYSDFYLSVSAESLAVALDSDLPQGRSYVYDPCEGEWFPEDGVASTTRLGNRMIRCEGWVASPPQVTIVRSGSDVLLRWTDVGAPYYQVSRATVVDGIYSVIVAQTPDSSYADLGAVPAFGQAFYYVTPVMATP